MEENSLECYWGKNSKVIGKVLRLSSYGRGKVTLVLVSHNKEQILVREGERATEKLMGKLRNLCYNEFLKTI